jgi:hypothetical protein
MKFNNKLQPVKSLSKFDFKQLQPFIDEYIKGNHAKANLFNNVKLANEEEAEEGYDLNKEEDLIRYANDYFYNSSADILNSDEASGWEFDNWLEQNPKAKKLIQQFQDSENDDYESLGSYAAKNTINPYLYNLLGLKGLKKK